MNNLISTTKALVKSVVKATQRHGISFLMFVAATSTLLSFQPVWHNEAKKPECLKPKI